MVSLNGLVCVIVADAMALLALYVALRRGDRLRRPAGFARPLGSVRIIVRSLRRSLAPTLLAYLATFVLVAW